MRLEEIRAAVHDTMPDGVQAARMGFLQPGEKNLQRCPVIGQGD